MQVSDKQLEACCKAYTDSKCASWEASPAAMRAALAVLPEPASVTAPPDLARRDLELLANDTSKHLRAITGMVGEVSRRVEQLERDNALMWELVDHHTLASINTVIREAAVNALNARKAGGR